MPWGASTGKPLAISLFAGAGGMDVGVDLAGFRTICAIELDPHCAATLRRNARRKVVWQADVRTLDPVRVATALELRRGELALLHGGPPAPPVQRVGNPNDLPDPRSVLDFEVVRFAEALRPAAILIEQAPNFLRSRTLDGTWLLEVLRDEFRRLGYDLHPDILDASDHGLAQRRKRAFIVCVQQGQDLRLRVFGDGKRRPTVGAALQGLPEPSAPGEDPAVPNHIDVTPPRDRERIAFVPEGLWLSKSPNVPADILLKLTRKDTTKFRRLDRSRLAPTLRSGEALFHPTADRYLTPREAARLQGFSDKHVFMGPIRRLSGSVRDLDQHRQVANAVPPPVARSAATDILRSLGLA